MFHVWMCVSVWCVCRRVVFRSFFCSLGETKVSAIYEVIKGDSHIKTRLTNYFDKKLKSMNFRIKYNTLYILATHIYIHTHTDRSPIIPKNSLILRGHYQTNGFNRHDCCVFGSYFCLFLLHLPHFQLKMFNHHAKNLRFGHLFYGVLCC